MGRSSAARVTPTRKVEWVVWRTYQSSATSKMKSPDWLMSWPIHRRLRLRFVRRRRKLGLLAGVSVSRVGSRSWVVGGLGVVDLGFTVNTWDSIFASDIASKLVSVWRSWAS